MSNEIVHVNKEEYFIQPVADIPSMLGRYKQMNDFVKSVLVDGTDYGLIPGAGDKPTLLKPGAEKLLTLFGLQVDMQLEEKIEDWTGDNHNGEPFFYYRYKCNLMRGSALIASGEGSSNSWETKFRYRTSNKKCPYCGKETIIKGKIEYGGGWLCYSKKGGCGAKFEDDDPTITNQPVGTIKNPNPQDMVNTLQKMAQKRALVAPTLIATNASAYFTQDVEDMVFEGAFVEAKENFSISKKAENIEPKNSEPKKQTNGKSYPAEAINPILKKYPGKTAFNVMGAFGASEKVSPDMPPELLLEWYDVYTVYRETMEVKDAAKAADQSFD